MTFFQFSPKRLPVFSGRALREVILNSQLNTIDASLGRGYILLNVERDNNVMWIGDSRFEYPLLEKLSKKPHRIYVLDHGLLEPLTRLSDDRYYQLVLPNNCRTPTIEISGIHMHRILVDPLFEDSYSKVAFLNPKPYKTILEICTGLGYSTYWLMRRKCRIVASIEKSSIVLDIAQYNPWSVHLEHVPILLGNAIELIHSFDSSTVDYIFHDPPRYSIAPELYSLDFYLELYRVLRHGGRLFHYVGRPGVKQGRRIVRGVLNRLRDSGFVKIRHREDIGGVVATKP